MPKIDSDVLCGEQAAAVPFRLRGDRLELALVSSRGGAHWIVPKGSIERGESARESAIREAMEEAGLVGELERGALGSYRYCKDGGTYRVRAYLLRVTHALSRWPEARLRERVWVSPAKARRLVRCEMKPVLAVARERLERAF